MTKKGNQRTKDKHLPKRMYLKSGSYYFVDQNKKWINLGRHYGNAIEKYNEFNVEHAEIYTIDDLITRYIKEVAPTKAESTYKSNLAEAKLLRAAFGKMKPEELKPRAIYMYLDARKAKIRANRELALLSHMFKKAIRWGVVDTNPCIGIERHPEKPRDRYVEDWEYQAFRAFVDPWMAAYMDFKLLTGLRQGDMLALKLEQLEEDGIHVLISKTKKQIIIRWSDYLRKAVEEVQASKKSYRAKESEYLFCTRRGERYASDGFRSIWHRKMQKAVEEGILKEKFREHDLRAKTGSDTDLEHAKSLLAHLDNKTTQRHYRRKAEVVEPLR
jgi:integrase